VVRLTERARIRHKEYGAVEYLKFDFNIPGLPYTPHGSLMVQAGKVLDPKFDYSGLAGGR